MIVEAIVARLLEEASKAQEASAEASYDAEKWKQLGRMQAFRDAAAIVQSPPSGSAFGPSVEPIGPALQCVVCMRGAHLKVDGTSYCRVHAMEVFKEIRGVVLQDGLFQL